MSVSSARLSGREVEGTRPGLGPPVSPLSPALGLSQLPERKLEHRRWWQLSRCPHCLLPGGGSCPRVPSPPARAPGPPEACGALALHIPWETCPLPTDSWATRMAFSVPHPAGMSRPRSPRRLGRDISMTRHRAGAITLHGWLRPLSRSLCPGPQVPPRASPGHQAKRISAPRPFACPLQVSPPGLGDREPAHGVTHTW